MTPRLSKRWKIKSSEFGYGGSWGGTTEETIKFKKYVGENYVRSYFRRVKGRQIVEIEPLRPFDSKN